MKKVLLQNLADGKWGQLLLVTIGYFLLFKTDKMPEIAIHHLTHFGAKTPQKIHPPTSQIKTKASECWLVLVPEK
ncbi:hypothetical protein CIK04_29745 [Vibrio sp. 03_296]|nr:hypothetical protein CIK04_29745 [Vibrio sp. 03_296]